MKKAGLGNRLLHWGKTIGPQHLLILPFIFVGWNGAVSIFEFLNIQTQRESTENLEEAIAHLQDHYQKANPGELTANLQAVDQMLLKNFTEITQWAHAIQERGQEEHLQCDYRILRTDTSNSPLQGITLVPMEIELQSQGPNGGYQGFLHILRELTQSPHRLDIQEVTMSGDGQKANHLKIGFTVWMKTIDSVEL